MKKSLLVLAVLSAVTAASAQSSVTLYGVVDAAVGATNHPGLGLKKNDQFQMISDKALNTGTSRFGFRSLEDLGDGSGKITASNPIVAGTTSNQNINGYSLGIRHNF